jgi:hypothetical protein
MGRFSYTNRLLRRYNQGIGAAAGAGAGAAAGASGAGGGVPWGPEEEPWQVPAGYTQPRPEAAIPSPRGATAAVGTAGTPGRSAVPSPAAADDGPGADPGLDLPLTTGGSYPAPRAPAASMPEAEGPAWPQEPALETNPAAPATAASPATTQAAGGAGARAPGHSQSPGSGEVPYFQPGADSDAVTTDADGYRDVDEAPSFTAFRPPEPSPPPAPSTSGSAPHPTPPARPAAPPRPPHTPSAAPTRDTSPGYLPELETGLGDPGRGEDSVYE